MGQLLSSTQDLLRRIQSLRGRFRFGSEALNASPRELVDLLAFRGRPAFAQAGHVDALINRGQVLLDREPFQIVQDDYPEAELNDG